MFRRFLYYIYFIENKNKCFFSTSLTEGIDGAVGVIVAGNEFAIPF